MTLRAIDQNLAHQIGRNPEELGTVVALHVSLVDQPEISFIDERGRLQGMTGSLAAEMSGRQDTSRRVISTDSAVITASSSRILYLHERAGAPEAEVIVQV
jgi:hypothetical protein